MGVLKSNQTFINLTYQRLKGRLSLPSKIVLRSSFKVDGQKQEGVIHE